MEELKKVQGHIVSYPLDFLKDDLQVSWNFQLPFLGLLIVKNMDSQESVGTQLA